MGRVIHPGSMGRKTLRSIAIACCLFIGIVGLPPGSLTPLDVLETSPASADVELFDDFNDGVRDRDKWIGGITGQGPTREESGGRLKLSLPAGSTAQSGAYQAYYTSRCKLQGDFDLQIDYELLEWPPSSGVRAFLYLDVPETLSTVERTSLGASEGGGEKYVAVFSNAYNSVSTSHHAGKIRFVRLGSSGIAYYNVGSGWIQYASGSVPPTAARFSIGLSTPAQYWSGATVRFAMDNMYLQGNLVCPSKVDLKQTWGHGPIDAINPSGSQSDPVNSLTGNFTSSATDLSLPGIGVPFDLTRSYNSLDTASDSLGSGWTHNHNTSLSIASNGNVTVRSENGQQTVFEKEPDGTFLGPTGALSTVTLITGGYELRRHDGTRYRFDSAGRATSQRDRNGQGLTYSHDASGNLATITDSAGRVINFTYNGAGRLTQAALPDGRNVVYGYTNGLLTSVTDVRGGTTTYEYDASSRLTKIIDQEGHPVITNLYGADGRVIKQTDALGKESTFAWDETTQTSTITDARGNAWKDVYADNVLIKRIDPLGNTTLFERDAKLDLVSITDPRGNKTTLAYDNRHNMTSRTAPVPLSHQESFAYDIANNLTSYTDGRNNITTYAYDASGNLTTITAPGNIVTAYGRDPTTGLVTSITDPRSKTTLMAYDTAGNLTSVTSPSGSKTTVDYDGSGRVVGIVEPRGNEIGAVPAEYRTTLAYDAANHLTSSTNPLSNQTRWTYRADGVLASVRDAKDRTTSYGYDANHRLVSVTAPDQTITTYAYDANGNLISRTDAKNHVTGYAYDNANRLRSITSPTNQVWTYSYDANGNLNTIVDAVGNQTPGDPSDGKTIMAHDVLNRLTALDYSGATPDVSFGYDANSNRTSMTDAFGTESYAYDALNRLTEVTRGGSAFAYGYDAAGNVTQRTYPDGTAVAYGYDDDSRIRTVSLGAATTTYHYDAAGNLTRSVLPAPNGHEERRSYDAAGRLTEVVNRRAPVTLSFARYVRDAVGNPTEVTTQRGTSTYSYDALDRLTEACFPLGCGDPTKHDFIRYTYDAVGNRLTEARPLEAIITYDYNASDQLLSRTGPSGTTSYSHDANGNMTSAGSTSYEYDLANRMTSVTKGAETTTYGYDGDGKRLRASWGGAAAAQIKYRWDANAPLPLLATEKDGADAPLRRYVYGNDLISMAAGGSDSYFHYDGLGSTTEVTNSLGLPQWSYDYEPFGTSRSALKVDPLAPENPMRFTGEYVDPSGLYHLRARQYGPDLGRFTTMDPIPPRIMDPSVSAYAYVKNGPTAFVDPSGMTPVNSACQFLPSPTTLDYLMGLQCPPSNFTYTPVLRDTLAGPRMADPTGECSWLADTGFAWDFRNACDTHDYGWDLVRANAPGIVKSEVDDFFLGDMYADCATRGWLGGPLCRAVADNAHFWVRNNEP